MKTDLSETASRRLRFAACYGTFAFNGALALSIGALLPFVRDAYGLNYAFAGLLVSLHSVGNLISSFVAGLLPLKLGRRKSILLFSACYAVSFLLILSTSSQTVLAAAFTLTGITRGAVSNFNNTEVNMLAPGQGWALNALHASFAVGAFSAPLLVLLCTQVLGSWRLMGGILIGFGLLEFAMYALMPLPIDRLEKSDQGGDLGFLRLPQFWITVGTLFFYLCAEQGVIGWMVTYFQDTGIMSAGYAQTMASVLWVLILAGRLTAAYLCSRVRPARLLVAMGCGMVAFFVVVLAGRTLPVITLGIAGFGFSMAGVYPTRVSMAGGLMKHYPLAWSFILTIASFGSILMPSIVGAVAETAGLQMGISTIVVAVALTLVMTVLNLLWENAHPA